MMQGNNGGPACAACKYQRKKCDENCVLAPFFPAEKRREFLAVHKVFGVSKITKAITSLKAEDQRKLAMESFVWEAFSWQKDPVLGPLGEYRKVHDELNLYKSQCQQIQDELNLYKSQCQQIIQAPTQGGMVLYKSEPDLAGWNSDNGMSTNSYTLNYIHNHGSSMVDSGAYSYPSNHHMHINSEQEGDVASVVIMPRAQQHSINYFNINQQQYYHLPAGQFNTIDAKPMESTIWEGS